MGAKAAKGEPKLQPKLQPKRHPKEHSAGPSPPAPPPRCVGASHVAAGAAGGRTPVAPTQHTHPKLSRARVAGIRRRSAALAAHTLSQSSFSRCPPPRGRAPGSEAKAHSEARRGDAPQHNPPLEALRPALCTHPTRPTAHRFVHRPCISRRTCSRSRRARPSSASCARRCAYSAAGATSNVLWGRVRLRPLWDTRA